MNKNRKEELLTRWLDDALSDEEVRELEPVLAENPEWHDERKQYRKMRGELRAAIPAEQEPPYPDFFNTHLERLVQEAMRSEKGAGTRRGAGPGRLWTLWLAPAAAAAVVAAFILGMNSAPRSAPPVVGAGGVGSVEGNRLLDAPGENGEAYSPLSSVSTDIIHDDALGATLIVVEGLEELSDQDLVIGGGSVEGEHGFFVTTGEIF